jgi:DNA-binding PadR family transcriptional regulator
MRDWLVTDAVDRDCLYAAQREGFGAWRPWRGVYSRARRLEKNGLLKKAGMSSMPPHIVYVLTDKGREELAVAARIDGQGAPADG